MAFTSAFRGRGRRAAPEAPDADTQRLAAENRKIKDDIAALCKRWRAAGSPSHAAELERVMGWTPAGDPLTGCLPVMPARE